MTKKTRKSSRTKSRSRRKQSSWMGALLLEGLAIVGVIILVFLARTESKIPPAISGAFDSIVYSDPFVVDAMQNPIFQTNQLERVMESSEAGPRIADSSFGSPTAPIYFQETAARQSPSNNWLDPFRFNRNLGR